MSRYTALGLSLVAISGLTACKTYPKGDMKPAALMAADQTSMTAVKTAAAEVLERDSVQLGASDYTQSPAISILPERSGSPVGAPFNQQDFAMPTMLLLMTDGTNCFLVKEDTRKLAHVKGVSCRPLG
jgi:hypothetical protein